jgi:hypothetical protein
LEEPEGEEKDLFNITLSKKGKVEKAEAKITRAPGKNGDEVVAKTVIGRAVSRSISNAGKQNAGQCARYTYNHALNYVVELAGKTNTTLFAAGGNAKDEGYWKNLEKLGYTRYNLGTKTKADLKDYLSGNNFNVGDIVVYWGTTGGGSESIYGHTQMYTAGLQDYKNSLKNPVFSNWATDNYSNYGTSFVYNSRPIDSWGLVHFKAPLKSPSIITSSSGTNIKLA